MAWIVGLIVLLALIALLLWAFGALDGDDGYEAVPAERTTGVPIVEEPVSAE